MIGEIVALATREIKKWLKNPFLLFMMIVQPIMWMGLFGKAFNITGLVNIDPSKLPPYINPQLISQMINETFNSIFGTTDYFTYMAAGMLSVIVLFTSMFSGMSIVWDRRFGFLNKVLVAPIKRESIVLAKVFSSVLRALFQSMLILAIAFAFGLKLGNAFGILDLLGILSVLFLLSLGLSSLFIALTVRITSHETVIALTNLLNLPIMFTSNALFPIKQMPNWLQPLANWNPISYSSDAIRKFIFHSETGLDLAQLATDFQFLIGFAIVFTALGLILAERGLRRK